jgi:two-component system sensor histidine kinase ChiS
LTNAYLSLEQARFGDKLKIEWDIETSSFWLPPLILQPIVENAVRHGIMKKTEGGTVRIHIHSTKDLICIEVQDDGVGFTAEFLESWQSNLWQSIDETGVGLKNVHLRLLTMYNFPLLIENQTNGGAQVTIRIRRGDVT